MSLQANALVGLATTKEALATVGSSQDTVIEAVINRASDFCERYCNRELKERSYTTLRQEAQRTVRLYPRNPASGLYAGSPIKTSATVTVSLNGTALTVWRAEADGDPEDFDVIVRGDHLYRAEGWGSSSDKRPDPAVLSYTGGLSPVPGDLIDACLLVIQKLFRDQTKQVAEVVSVNTPTGGMTLLDTVIPRRARAALDAYRVIAL